MNKNYILILLLMAICCNVSGKVKTGADKIDEYIALLNGKRVGVIVNQTSVIENGSHLVDTLLKLGVNITTIFAPEHGFRGNADAGETISNGVDKKSGLPIISLYGKNKKPTKEQLAKTDILLFDIQDVGARFYTYISTMYYAMQAAARDGVGFIVLDRPNPNDFVDGPVIDESLFSFVGAMPLPIVHGLTVGELATMIKGENWGGTKNLNLKVITVEGWRHGVPYHLSIKPSPNLPNDRSVAFYPSICLFESTIISVGRGTVMPFQVIGAPDKKLGSFSFSPTSLDGFDKNPMHNGKTCYGRDLRREAYPKGFSLSYLIDMYRLSKTGDSFFSSPSFFDKLSGDTMLRQEILKGKNEKEIRSRWNTKLNAYKDLRKHYLLYPDYVQ
ncbi:MAG: DUF1343 domain-containing protein [Bacteroidales bacterium]